MEDAILTLLSLLPPEYRSTAEAALALMAALSILLVPLKALAVRAPAHWRPWLDGLFKFLDLVSVNTRGLHTRPAKPPRRSVPPVGLILLLAFPLLTSCTGNALPRLRTALDVLRSLQSPAQEIAERACTAKHGDGATECVQVHDVFEAVRTLREEAEKLAPPDDAGTDAQ